MRKTPFTWWIQTPVDEVSTDIEKAAACRIRVPRTEEADPCHEVVETLLGAKEAAQPELLPPVSEDIVDRGGDNVVEHLVTQSLVARLCDATSGEEGLRGWTTVSACPRSGVFFYAAAERTQASRSSAGGS